jgi:hypothetical protein
MAYTTHPNIRIQSYKNTHEFTLDDMPINNISIHYVIADEMFVCRKGRYIICS